jgi:hypothetical protein
LRSGGERSGARGSGGGSQRWYGVEGWELSRKWRSHCADSFTLFVVRKVFGSDERSDGSVKMAFLRYFLLCVCSIYVGVVCTLIYIHEKGLGGDRSLFSTDTIASFTRRSSALRRSSDFYHLETEDFQNIAFELHKRILVPRFKSNGAAYFGSSEKYLLTWGSDGFMYMTGSNYHCLEEYSEINIFAIYDGQLKNVLHILNPGNTLVPLFVDLDTRDGFKDILFNCRFACSGGYGKSILICETAGNTSDTGIKGIQTLEITQSPYTVECNDVDGDGVSEILAYRRCGGYHCGEKMFPFLYNYDRKKNTLRYASMRAKCRFYREVFIPELRRELASGKRNGPEYLYVFYRKKALDFSERLCNGEREGVILGEMKKLM